MYNLGGPWGESFGGDVELRQMCVSCIGFQIDLPGSYVLLDKDP